LQETDFTCCIYYLLWPPYRIGQAIIFLPFYLLSFFPRLISAVAGWIMDVCHTSTHGVALVRI